MSYTCVHCQIMVRLRNLRKHHIQSLMDYFLEIQVKSLLTVLDIAGNVKTVRSHKS